MASNDPKDLLDALSAPVGDLIASVGRSVAEAQQSMDMQALETFRAIYDESGGDERLGVLRQLGYQPTWYQIPEVTAEINVALSIVGNASAPAQSTSGSKANVAQLASARLAPKARLYAAPVDAGYTNRYGYDIKAASVVRFRIVPVPAPTAAEGMKVAPSLKKPGGAAMTYAEAQALLTKLDIPWELMEGSKNAGVVAEQRPAAGELVVGSLQLRLA